MPIDAMFVGKLFAMLAASVLGLVVWIGAGRAADPAGQARAASRRCRRRRSAGRPSSRSAVVYFAMNYLLLGAAFLTIGAQASTAREVQTMSMPVTFAQVLIFGFAATAIGSAGFGRGRSPRRSSRCPRRWRCSPAPPQRAGSGGRTRRDPVAGAVGRADPALGAQAVPQDGAEVRAAPARGGGSAGPSRSPRAPCPSAAPSARGAGRGRG